MDLEQTNHGGKTMKTVNILVICSLLIAGVACKEKVKGTAKVRSNFSVTKKPGSDKMMTIPSGNYHVEIKASNSKAKIELKGTKDKYKFKADLPDKIFKSTLYKDFKLSPKQLGQEIYIIGSSDTTNSDSAEYSKYESCVYDSYEEKVCTPGYYTGGDKVCVTIAADGAYKCTYTKKEWVSESCSWETSYIYGDQTVYGFDRTQTKTLKMTIKDRNSKRVAEMYFPNETKSYYVETGSSSCQL